MKNKRIAAGGFIHETNTFSTVPTDYPDFEILQGEALLKDRLAGRQDEDVELFPALFAEALPSGLLRLSAYNRLKEELLRSFQAALPLDGVFLDLHGAMEVEGIGDAEGDFTASVRQLIGPEPLISVSLDLHGNISPTLVDSANILTAYRTAPHRDMLETRQRAFTHLLQALRTEQKPLSVLIKPPLLLPGEAAVTEVEPARTLYAGLAELDQIPGILDASLLIGCAWTDSEYASTSVIVVAEQDRGLAERHARSFAQQVWDKRKEFQLWGEAAAVEDAVEKALSSNKRPVFISDSGDNITAGAAGDIPLLAERLLAAEAKEALVAGITDPQAVEQCFTAGLGAQVELSIGGKLDKVHGKALTVKGQVQHLHWDRVKEGKQPAMALLKISGVSILLVVDRRFLIDRAGITEGGLDPMQQKVVVVKQGYLFPDLYDHAPRGIMALSPGATALQLETLNYQNVKRPIYPLDSDLSWHS